MLACRMITTRHQGPSSVSRGTIARASGFRRSAPLVARHLNVRAAAAKQDEATGGQVGNRGAKASEGFHYPEYENDSMDDGFLPKRQPGEFPPVGHHMAGAEVLTVEGETAPAGEKEFDPLRDGPLRYLGYANELGEAFAAWLPPGGVPLSYAVAIAYVLTDTGDKTIKTYNAATKDLVGAADIPASVDTPALARLLATERMVDTVVWQLLASVALPGYTIHTVVAIVHKLLDLAGLSADQVGDNAFGLGAALQAGAAAAGLPADQLVGIAEKSLPTAAGLLAIPFIVHPIDNGVHAVLNYTLRPYFRTMISNSGGQEAGLDMCTTTAMHEEFPVLSGKHSGPELLGMWAKDVVTLTASETEPTPLLTRSMDSDDEEASAAPQLDSKRGLVDLGAKNGNGSGSGSGNGNGNGSAKVDVPMGKTAGDRQ